jgi:long-subunit fatty acid transport protein
MKQIILFTILIFSSLLSYSQISFGITGGVLIPVHKYKDSLASPSSAYKVGLEVMYRINDHWKVRTGIEYASFKFAKTNFPYRPLHPDSIQFFNAQYISIPIGLRYVFKGDKIKPFIDGSMSFMGNIGHYTQYRNQDLTPTFNPTPKSFILSPSLGAGIMVNPSKNIYLTFMASYSMQIGYVYEMYNNKHELEKLRYNSINAQLAIGYNF